MHCVQNWIVRDVADCVCVWYGLWLGVCERERERLSQSLCICLCVCVQAGDRSLADVVAHEISHSWTGNLVTNSTFEDFWYILLQLLCTFIAQCSVFLFNVII